MHRIRYYKINGRMVWDRMSKLDILTRSEQQNETSDGTKKNLYLSFSTVNEERKNDENTSESMNFLNERSAIHRLGKALSFI
jgi:hypothetical protein